MYAANFLEGKPGFEAMHMIGIHENRFTMVCNNNVCSHFLNYRYEYN